MFFSVIQRLISGTDLRYASGLPFKTRPAYVGGAVDGNYAAIAELRLHEADIHIERT